MVFSKDCYCLRAEKLPACISRYICCLAVCSFWPSLKGKILSYPLVTCICAIDSIGSKWLVDRLAHTKQPMYTLQYIPSTRTLSGSNVWTYMYMYMSEDTRHWGNSTTLTSPLQPWSLVTYSTETKLFLTQIAILLPTSTTWCSTLFSIILTFSWNPITVWFPTHIPPCSHPASCPNSSSDYLTQINTLSAPLAMV